MSQSATQGMTPQTLTQREAPAPAGKTQRRADGPALRALAGYGVLILLALLATLAAWRDLSAAQANLAVAEEQWARLRANGAAAPAQDLPGYIAGSAFLRADKPTLAAADLQRRMGAAVQDVGGVLSTSQVELSDSEAPVAHITLAVECSIALSQLQRLLHDIETATPLVFVTAMNVRLNPDTASAADPRLTLTLRLRALWRRPA